MSAPLAQRLLEAIKLALQEQDMPAVAALLRKLAIVDPVSTQMIYDVVQARAAVAGGSPRRAPAREPARE